MMVISTFDLTEFKAVFSEEENLRVRLSDKTFLDESSVEYLENNAKKVLLRLILKLQ